jgi:hypothetical protein
LADFYDFEMKHDLAARQLREILSPPKNLTEKDVWNSKITVPDTYSG